jgi:hypothetical protein
MVLGLDGHSTVSVDILYWRCLLFVNGSNARAVHVQSLPSEAFSFNPQQYIVFKRALFLCKVVLDLLVLFYLVLAESMFAEVHIYPFKCFALAFMPMKKSTLEWSYSIQWIDPSSWDRACILVAFLDISMSWNTLSRQCVFCLSILFQCPWLCYQCLLQSNYDIWCLSKLDFHFHFISYFLLNLVPPVVESICQAMAFILLLFCFYSAFIFNPGFSLFQASIAAKLAFLINFIIVGNP